MAEISLADLERGTGVSYKTLKRRLEGVEPVRVEGHCFLYDVVVALQRVLPKPQELRSLTEEKTRLVAAKADIAETERDILVKKLVYAEDAHKGTDKVIMACRARLLVLPSRAALQLENRLAPEVEVILKGFMNEILTELGRTNGR